MAFTDINIDSAIEQKPLGPIAGRRLYWIALFILSVSCFALAVSSSIATSVLAGLLSLMLIAGARYHADAMCGRSNFHLAVSAVMTAAVFWLSIILAWGVVFFNSADPGSISVLAVALIALVLFAGIMAVEAMVSIAMQFILPGRYDPAISTASLIEAKYAGYFGDTV